MGEREEGDIKIGGGRKDKQGEREKNRKVLIKKGGTEKPSRILNLSIHGLQKGGGN